MKAEVKKFTKKDIFISTIIEKIEKVNLEEWENYLKEESFNLYYHNPFTSTIYKRSNAFMIFLFHLEFKYKSNCFATFKQIKEAGGKIKKGAKSIPIEFFNFDIKEKETSKKISLSEYKTLSEEEKKKYIVIPYLVNFRIFNFDCIENVEEMKIIKEEDEILNNDIKENEDIEKLIQKLIQEKGLNLKYGETQFAYYNSGKDEIMLPLKEYFKDETKYYSTFFHELIHWTGHKNRLNRINLLEYSLEELVAEIGSIIFCIDFNIYKEFSNSLKYLKGWINNMNEKETELREAFNKSKKAISYIYREL